MEGPLYAKVAIDLDTPHLNHPFDYRLPPKLVGNARVGSLVSVPFGRRTVSGCIVDITRETEFEGDLQPIRRVASPIPLISKSMLAVSDHIATRFAVSFSQVLSLALPKRTASVEKGMAPKLQQHGEAQQSPKEGSVSPRRMVANVAPFGDLPLLRAAAVTQKSAGRGLIAMFPTAASSIRAAAYLQQTTDLRVGLTHNGMEPADRYRVHLEMLLGNFDVVVGTRSAAWMSFPNLGAIFVWDDGNDLYRERRAPTVDALDILVARSHIESIDLLIAGYVRTVKAQYLVETGWANQSEPDRETIRELIPKVQFFGDEERLREGASGSARLPGPAYTMIRKGLETGPVLVQVLASGHTEQVTVEKGGREAETYLRVGADRIGEELAAAFPHADVTVSSSTSGIQRHLDGRAQIVVATGSAEPQVDGGYHAVIITGAAGTVYQEKMDTKIGALRRWMAALALAAPKSPALVVGEVPADLRSALVLWKPVPVATELLAERQTLGFAPTRWVVAVEGEKGCVQQAVETAEGVFGPVSFSMPGEEKGDLVTLGAGLVSASTVGTAGAGLDERTQEKVILSVANRDATRLMTALGSLRERLSQARQKPLSIQINPEDLV